MTAFDALLVPDDLREAVSGRAWLTGMLDAERALAAAEVKAGIVPADAAAAIGAACDPGRYDFDELLVQGRLGGAPVEPLVRALREQVDGEAASWVHWGATSQDILDTAAMLVATHVVELILAESRTLAEGCAALAERYRATPMAARTLLQHAVPTTFGLKAAGWLVAVLDARRALAAIRLPAQLGGAAGTLGALGARGPEVTRLFAAEVGLEEPTLPWHTNRTVVAGLGSALAILAGVAGKLGRDVTLLAQTEVGEVSEAVGGDSSTMPHKHNPVGSVLAIACSRRAAAAAGELVGALVQEHERAAGAWHAETPGLCDALAYSGAAVAWARDVVGGLEVHPERMRENLDPSLAAEQVAFALTPALGRAEAHALVREAGSPLREALLADPRVTMTPELEAAFDPQTALAAVDELIDRALARAKEEL